jgi:hypothetical protein
MSRRSGAPASGDHGERVGLKTTFRVASVVDISGSSIMLLHGEVLTGEVKAGMFAALPWDEEFDMVVPIAAVEHLGAPPAGTKLAVAYANELERVLWRRLDLRDAVIEVTDAPPAET